MAARSIVSKMSFYDIVTLIVPSAMVCYAYNWVPIELKRHGVCIIESILTNIYLTQRDSL